MNDRREIARQIKEGRVAKGYTQQELADLTGISLRSVQRIENAEVLPRSYTLRLLSARLDLPVIPDGGQNGNTPAPEARPEPTASLPAAVRRRLNKSQKLILSGSSALVLVLLTLAFVAQSAGFPETQFELFLLLAGLLGFYALLLLRIWK
jgi:transcriptional regulator with XRE-family HTH domain